MGQKAQVGDPACRYGVMDPDVPAAPRCPTCGTGIQPHWDWCHFCGYDPDHLKPAGWLPGMEPRAEPEPTGRRHKRAGRNEEKRSNRKADKSRKAAKQAAKASARQPVAAGVVPGAAGSAQNLPPVATAAPMPVVDEDTVDIASMLDPFVLHDDEPAPAPRRSSIPPLVIEATPARPNGARPVLPTTVVFHVKPAAVELGLAAVLGLVGIGAAYLGVTGIIQVAEGASTTMLDNVATVFFILLCSVAAFAALAQARALLRQSVELTPTEMAVHNRFGRVRRVPRNEIHALRMSERQYPTPKGVTGLEVPYVQLTDGSGIWLDALGSRNPTASPTAEQQAMYDQLAAALASTGTRL